MHSDNTTAVVLNLLQAPKQSAWVVRVSVFVVRTVCALIATAFIHHGALAKSFLKFCSEYRSKATERGTFKTSVALRLQLAVVLVLQRRERCGIEEAG